MTQAERTGTTSQFGTIWKQTLAVNKHGLSDNAGGVKYFLSVLLRALPRARHFALVEAFAVALAFALPTKVRS